MVMVSKKAGKELQEAALAYNADEPVEPDDEFSTLSRLKLWPAPDGKGYTARPHLQVPAAEFKARCLALMDLVAENGGDVVITKRGKPLVKLVPFTERPIPDLRGSVLYESEDCWDPIDAEWDAMK